MCSDDDVLLRGKIADFDILVGSGRCDFGAILELCELLPCKGFCSQTDFWEKQPISPLRSRSSVRAGCVRTRADLGSGHLGRFRRYGPCCPNSQQPKSRVRLAQEKTRDQKCHRREGRSAGHRT